MMLEYFMPEELELLKLSAPQSPKLSCLSFQITNLKGSRMKTLIDLRNLKQSHSSCKLLFLLERNTLRHPMKLS